jgi:hypothetical protein
VCARGDGIRGSKDLRAGLRKYLKPTNERKKMSTKTIKQRIAVVAVSALTAGLFSVIATPSANASTVASGGGIAVTTATGTVTLPTMNGASTTGTGTLVVTGNVTLSISGGSSGLFVEARVAGGTFTSVTDGIVNSDSTKAYQAAATSTAIKVTAKPSTAGRNMVITTYTGTTAATAAASTTVIETLTITVVAAGVSGVVSTGNSFIKILNTASTIGDADSNTDIVHANVVAAGGYGAIGVLTKDGALNNMPATTTLQATVKSGACIVDTDTSPAVTSVSATNFKTTFYVAQADAVNTPATNCLVEISADGTVIGSKTLTFQGPVAKINLISVGRATASSTGTATTSGIGFITTTDSAGNVIGNVATTGYIVNATDANIITDVVDSTTAANAGVNGGTSPNAVPTSIGLTCVASTPTTPVKIQYRVPNGTGGFILSDVIDMYCGSSTPVNYKASLDKASYVPGEIATLTITATDSKGAAVADAATLGAGSTISVSGAGVLTAVTAPASLDTFSGGKATYKFTVGTTGGSYNVVVDLTARNSTTYSQSAVAVPFSIKTAGTTNEDILKSIVSLIASINKQIQALQKLILRR